MSKKYVFLTYVIINLGGGQIYCSNKFNYLKNQGYETYIFSTYDGRVVVKNIERFLPLVIEKLDFYPTVFDKKTVEKVLDKICEKIDYTEDDEIIIESHTEYLAVWGELLAKRLNAKHIIYLLGEHFDGLSNYVFKFLDFKYNRKELANINKVAMQRMFAPYKNLSEEDCFFLYARLGVPVEEIEISKEYIEKCKNKKVIGVIGRGDKNYVFESVKIACEFAEKHTDEKFVLLVVGSIVPGISEQIENYAKDYQNVDLMLTGDQFPIPKKLLHLMNAAFAAAGCVAPPYYEEIPTIVMNVYNNKPIGVMGYDTLVTVSKEQNSKNNGDYYLEEIIYGNFLEENKYTAPEPIDFNAAYEKHFDFIKNSCDKKEYYDFSNMRATKKDKIFSILYKIGGVKLIRKLKKLKSKL
ncbi:MAG: hypothetical protein IIU65_02940 [Clostridia bacterium]|nr:hypothetical protein [Clostridia bacterium]